TLGKGFIIMVEGSQIDIAGHDNDYDHLIAEMKEFDDAVGVAFDYADRNPGTLVVVLADHETGGLSLVPGDPDFTKGESGVTGSFSTGGHSAVMIPMFAYGAGASNFT
ncbi:MAG: alkaline phosphatase, partial [Alistipes sp.]|nr:alkaline phosphatase [Alistipes sp.]